MSDPDVKRLLKSLYQRTVSVDAEASTVLAFACAACVGSDSRTLLDVGCGYGRYLRMLTGHGFDATGVDISEQLVAQGRGAGLNCMTLEEFARTSTSFDVILMSHVIEHFPPAELLRFLDSYLDRLRPGGWLIVATPLMSPYFYDDFDHVRPFHPVGLDMVFGERAAQVQYQSRNCLALRDVWFRRSPYRITYARGVYIRSFGTRIVQIAGLALALLFRLSFGLFGRTDGWVGLYQKTGTRPGASV